MKAKGAISTTPSCNIPSISFAVKYSCRTSKIGLVHGAIFCSNVPGKNPRSSSALTAGLVTTILSTEPSLNCFIAVCTANSVLPVPAGPMPKTMFSLSLTVEAYTILVIYFLEGF